MAKYEITNEQEPIEFEVDDERRRIIQNAQNLLRTRMGEVPFDRMRGFDSALFDLPAEEFRARLMPEVDRLLLWEPRVSAAQADFRLNENGETVIRVVIEIEEG